MKLEYYQKSVYGRNYFYLVDEGAMNAVRALTDRQTLREQDIQALKELNFEMELVSI